MNILQRFIPVTNKKTRPGLRLVPTFITIHETDNTDAGANAEAHASLQERGNSRQASWHLTVDDVKCFQSIPFSEIAWAAGDGENGPGNRSSIHLEICVNDGGDFKKAVANAADVTRQLMESFDIPLDHVVQHNKWSGKNCPRYLRDGSRGINWNDFVSSLNQKVPAATIPQPPPSASGNEQVLTVKTSATHYASGEPIADFVKGQQYKVLQVKEWVKSNSKKAYLLDGIMSWVLEQDIVESGVSNGYVAPSPQPTQPKKQYVVLPASEPTWTVYKLDRPPVKSNPANIAGVLKPSKFGGLEYEILADRGNWVFEIQTSNFGRVQIFADPSATSARVIEK